MKLTEQETQELIQRIGLPARAKQYDSDIDIGILVKGHKNSKIKLKIFLGNAMVDNNNWRPALVVLSSDVKKVPHTARLYKKNDETYDELYIVELFEMQPGLVPFVKAVDEITASFELRPRKDELMRYRLHLLGF